MLSLAWSSRSPMANASYPIIDWMRRRSTRSSSCCPKPGGPHHPLPADDGGAGGDSSSSPDGAGRVIVQAILMIVAVRSRALRNGARDPGEGNADEILVDAGAAG
jgi:hypothetical protein